MNVISKIKQIFCKHDMQKVTTYDTKMIENGKITKCELFEIYECSKCGKEEYELVPQPIPEHIRRYNDL